MTDEGLKTFLPGEVVLDVEPDPASETGIQIVFESGCVLRCARWSFEKKVQDDEEVSIDD